MLTTVVFLWSSAGLPSPSLGPSASQLGDLGDFGAAHGLSFLALSSRGRPSGLPANEAVVVDEIEAELEQARTALSALEEGTALVRLSRVESQLLAHPHLPQAAFLMGECLALRAVATREQSPALSVAFEARRQALEGPRATAFGDMATPHQPAPRLDLTVQGLAPLDELELDGAALGTARHVQLAAGLHHARVWRHGRPIFAAFSEVVSEQQALTVDAPTLEPCSAEDLDGGGMRPGSVLCPRWAKVRAEPSGIGVAMCEQARCGAFTHWERHAPAPFRPIAAERGGLPTWAGFALAGAGLALATSVVLWQAGTFDRGRPTAATWEYGGLNPQGLRF